MFKAIISQKAKDHTQEAYEYYEQTQSLLGERFLQNLEQQYEQFKYHPNIIPLYLLKKTFAL